MNKDIIMEVRNKFFQNGIILSFVGHFSQGIIEEMGEAIRTYLSKDKESKKSSNKIFSIFIEQSQNIRNYEKKLLSKNIEIDDAFLNGIILVGKDNDGKYYSCAGNTVKKEDIDIIRTKLEEINNLSKDEIKKLFKERLKASPESDTGGAGLGFLEMAKRATEKFDYNFIKIEDDFYYFVIIVKV